MRNKNIIKAIAFITGVVILFIGSSYAFKSLDKNIEGYYFNEPENTINYLVIGDSECATSFSPMEIWKEYGYTGYNCGTCEQSPVDLYVLLKRLLKKQQPKVILMEANVLYRYDDFFVELSNVTDCYTKEILPIYKHHDEWKDILENSKKEKFIDPFKGIRFKTEIQPYKSGDYVKETKEVAKINKIALSYLNKVVELCNEKDIQLILYNSPSPLCWTYPEHNRTVMFAKKNELPYIDLNFHTEELGIDWFNDTYDKGDHMNFVGAKKVTKYMGVYLSEHTDLKDHRNEEKYTFWNEELNEYLKQTSQIHLEKTKANN